ncbi:MAG: DNA recombination protein RmuC [Nocardioides sp.]|uniref:DNA recombination protein RmuC n=1 Tax=Nocardioides sp. TaxID=35761 RepID=UPI0039E4822D
MEIWVLLTGLAWGLVLGAGVGWLAARVRTAAVDAAASGTAEITEVERRSLEQQSADRAVVQEGLERLQDQLRDLEHNRAAWQGQLAQQVLDMRHTADLLRRETQSLATALRRPQVRGRWGELHLRRAVELAGMVPHVDFTEQEQLADGALRPDLVVKLAGGRRIVVDAKVPLDAFLDACSADDDRDHHMRRHAGQLRQHVDNLAAKRYWRALPETPEFVVLFVPAESFLSAALEVESDLLEYAAARQVVLATPTTLIALLRTVAHGWTHETLADQAQEIHRLGRDLHARLATMSGHLDQVGRSLNAAVTHFNTAVGSLETRVLVSARRFSELAVTDDELPGPRQVEVRARTVAVRSLPREVRRGADAASSLDHNVAL